MKLIERVGSWFTGGLFSEIKDLITEYFPPDMPPEKQAELRKQIDQLEHKKQMDIMAQAADAERVLNERINQQEGTARDLKQLPFVGRIVLFLRGLQRPVWGFFVIYLDYVWFMTQTNYTEQQQTALIVINLLVLGFLFGERTVKNLEPLIIKVFGRG